VPPWVAATRRMSFESLNQLSATTRGGGSATPRRLECRYAPIQHALDPVQFVAAGCPRAYGVGPTDGKIDGHHEFAIADDDHEEDPINTRQHPVFLAASPGANQT
jgi:hypothetical protein